MRQEQGKGGTTLGMATEAKPASQRPLPKDLLEPRKKGKGIGKGLRNAIIAGVALTGLGGVGVGLYENNQSSAPSTFDNSIEKITIGDNNITRITPEEAKAKGLLEPKYDPSTKTVTTLPIVSPQPGNKATLDKTFFTVHGMLQTDPRITPEQKGAEVILPEGTNFVLIKGNPDAGDEDPNLIYQIIGYWFDNVNNITITWHIYSFQNGTNVPLAVDPTLKEAELAIQDLTGGKFGLYENWKNLPVADGKTVLARTTQDNQQLTVGERVTKGNDFYYIDPATIAINGTTFKNPTEAGKLLVVDSSS